MEKIKTLLVDNETEYLEALYQELVTHCPHIEVVGKSQSFQDAYAQINEKKPDLVFVDVFHQSTTSFELLDLFNPIPFKVIFVSSHDEFAVKAFKYSALDYIIKPVSSLDLISAVKRVRKNITSEVNFSLLKEQIATHTIIPKLAVSSNQHVELVDINDIIYFEADKNYTVLYTATGKHVISKNLKELEYLMEGQAFFRPHKSYLININHIKSYTTKDDGYITMLNKTIVPISQRKKQIFLELMNTLYRR